MELIPLSQEKMAKIKPEEAVTLASIMAIAAIAIVAVVVYKLFLSKKGTTTIPGGWKFTWN